MCLIRYSLSYDFIATIFCSITLIIVSCLHLGQNSGKFSSTVSGRTLIRVLLLQIGQSTHFSFSNLTHLTLVFCETAAIWYLEPNCRCLIMQIGSASMRLALWWLIYWVSHLPWSEQMEFTWNDWFLKWNSAQLSNLLLDGTIVEQIVCFCLCHISRWNLLLQVFLHSFCSSICGIKMAQINCRTVR